MQVCQQVNPWKSCGNCEFRSDFFKPQKNAKENAVMTDANATVTAGATVSLEYTLTHEGKTLESNVGNDPLVYTHGQQQIIPGLEKELTGTSVGDSKEIVVSPEEAYGPVHEKAFVEVKKEQIPEEAHKVGVQLQTQDAQGNPMHPRVKEVKDETIILDFNHPLAGKTLKFDVTVMAIQ